MSMLVGWVVISLSRLTPDPNSDQIFARLRDPELTPKALVIFDKIAREFLAPRGLEGSGDGLRGTKAGNEQLPGGLPARHTQRGRAGLKFEIERRPEERTDALGTAPFQWRGRGGRRRWRQVGSHHI